MMKKNRVDHLYKYIEIDPQTLEFINSDPIQDKVTRLSGLSQLGLTSKVFPSVIHTKLEHSLGVYFLADYLLRYTRPSKEIINPVSFKIAAIIHGIGHFPFSLSTEVVFQKISFFNKATEDFINQRIEPVIDRLTKDIDKRKRDKFRKQIIKERKQINHFYRFFTASFLLDNEIKLRKGFENSASEFNFDELLKYLSFPENIGFRLLTHIDKLDYVLRDMFHLGLIKIDLNLTPYFRNLKALKDGRIEFPSAWDALKEIESYAVREIYNDPRVKAIEAIYETLIMKMLSDGEIAPAALLKRKDDELEREIQAYQEDKGHKHKLSGHIDKIRGEFNDLPRYYFSQSNDVVSSKNLLLVEGRSKSIAKKTLSKEIDKSIDNSIFKGSYFASFADRSDINVNLVCLEKSQIKHFLIEVGRYENCYKKANKNQIAQCIWGIHFGKIDFGRYNLVIEELFIALKKKRGLTDARIDYQIVNQFSPKPLPEKIAAQEEILRAVMHMIGVSRRKIFLINPEDKLFDENFLQGLNFSNQQAFLSFVKTLCDKRVKTIKDFKGKTFEYFTYLKKVCELERRNGQIKKWVFPSTIITGRGDLDAWVIKAFKNRRPLIELIECSTTTSETKELEARTKLKQKKQLLQERFGTKVKIKTFFNDSELHE
jgi:HD superfamily phosphohydrolase